MTYDEIIKKLRSPARDCAAGGLENAVREEACTLIESGNRWGSYLSVRHARMRIPSEHALAAAREFYAEDITEQLNNPLPLDPYRLLSHRRLAVAWAVAQILKVDFDTEADRVARQSGGREDFHSDG